MPFVVQTDGKNKFVNIGIVAGLHGSHVTGIAAGNALFGGKMSGAAPGAQVVSSRACLFVAGCTGHALLEGMIYVAKQANADVINMSIGGLPQLNDGNNARCAVYERLIDQEKVQMFLSIGNSGPGLNTAGDPGLCDKVMGMGAYLTDDTMLADYGVEVGYQDNLHYLQLARSARGRWLLADGGRTRRRDQHHSALAAAGLPGADLPGRVRARQWHLDGVATVGGRRRTARERCEGDRRAVEAGADSAGAHVERELHHRGRAVPGRMTRVPDCSTSMPHGISCAPTSRR